MARKSMLPRMWSQLPCRNIAVIQLIAQGSGAWHAPLTGAPEDPPIRCGIRASGRVD